MSRGLGDVYKRQASSIPTILPRFHVFCAPEAFSELQPTTKSTKAGLCASWLHVRLSNGLPDAAMIGKKNRQTGSKPNTNKKPFAKADGRFSSILNGFKLQKAAYIIKQPCFYAQILLRNNPRLNIRFGYGRNVFNRISLHVNNIIS